MFVHDKMMLLTIASYYMYVYVGMIGAQCLYIATANSYIYMYNYVAICWYNS